MLQRNQAESALLETLAICEQGRGNAYRRGNRHDTVLWGAMLKSTKYALDLLLHGLPHSTLHRFLYVHQTFAWYSAVSDRLDRVLSVLSRSERELIYLTVGYGVSLEGAAVAVGIDSREARILVRSARHKLGIHRGSR